MRLVVACPREWGGVEGRGRHVKGGGGWRGVEECGEGLVEEWPRGCGAGPVGLVVVQILYFCH